MSTLERREELAPHIDPLSEVSPALDRLGLLEGEFAFDITGLEPAADILVLMRQNQSVALALYSCPVSTGLTLEGEEYLLVRNQVLSYDSDDKLCLFTNDALQRADLPPHPIGQALTETSNLLADPEAAKLIHRLDILLQCVRTEDLLDETEVAERLKY